MTNNEVMTYTNTVSEPQHDLGGKRTQQDYGLVIQDGEWTFVGLWDGHGQDGFSNAAGAAAESYISQSGFYEKLIGDPESTAKDLFNVMQQSNFDLLIGQLNNSQVNYEIRDGHIYVLNINKLRGGTTATLIFVNTSGLVITMNVGDSDVWMHSTTESTKLTADHLPETLGEYERLMALSTSECKYDRPSQLRAKSSSDVIPLKHVQGLEPFTPYYVSNVDDKPATIVCVTDPTTRVINRSAMTRSIGDENLKKGGIISTPSVRIDQLTENVVIKIASDGYWDALNTVDGLSRTNAALIEFGDDANAIAGDWYKKTKETSDKLFGGVGDNMWGYVIVIKKN